MKCWYIVFSLSTGGGASRLPDADSAVRRRQKVAPTFVVAIKMIPPANFNQISIGRSFRTPHCCYIIIIRGDADLDWMESLRFLYMLPIVVME
jgi:hypothetical protein